MSPESAKDDVLLDFLRLLSQSGTRWVIQDHWGGDRAAIGVASEADPLRLAYVSIWSQKPGHLFVELELGASPGESYDVVGEYDNCPIADAVRLVARHLAVGTSGSGLP